MNVSKYKLGWIGLRVERLGRSVRLLKRAGWMRFGHAEPNNRNGFDWLRPMRTKEEFAAEDWQPLTKAGLVGVAVWFSDAQWQCNAQITDQQWRERLIVK